jgi:hypothetical protein
MMRIKEVEYIKEYKLKLFFNNSKSKVVDLEEIVKKGKGMFSPLKNLEYFKQVLVDSDGITICWPNGADLSPDVLYEMGKDVEKTKKKHLPKQKHIAPSAKKP